MPTIMDKRCIRDVRVISEALNAVKAMEPILFSAADTLGFVNSAGVSSQSITGDASVAVSSDLTGVQSVDLEQLVPVLVKAVQELAEEVEALKSKRTTRKTVVTEKAE